MLTARLPPLLPGTQGTFGACLPRPSASNCRSSGLLSLTRHELHDKTVCVRKLLACHTSHMHTHTRGQASMMSAEFFDCMQSVLAELRGNKKPFGGIQFILCGDFAQLGPITSRYPPTQKQIDAKVFLNRGLLFEAQAWSTCNFTTVELHQIWRQVTNCCRLACALSLASSSRAFLSLPPCFDCEHHTERCRLCCCPQ